MTTIHTLKLSRGSKSVTLYVHDDDQVLLLDVASAHGIHYGSRGYATAETLAAAWERFLLMRLALHEHHPPPLVPINSRRDSASHTLLTQSRAALDAILTRIRHAPDLPSRDLLVERLKDARAAVDDSRSRVQRTGPQ